MENQFVLGALDSGVDLRDYTYDMISCASSFEKLPESFRLEWKYPILNQGTVGSCVAHALSQAKSYIDGVLIADMYSVGYIYGNRKDTDSQRTGMVTRQALSNLVDFGDCYKKDFPVNEEYPQIKSTIDKYGRTKLSTLASQHKSTAYVRLDKDDIKEYLYRQQKPIVIAVHVYDNFYEANTNGGKIPSKPSGNKRGGHAMIIIGYDKDELIIVNSWGEIFGDKGIYYLDINSQIIKELWAIEDKKNIMKPEPKPNAKYKIGWNKDPNGWWYSPDGFTYCKDCWSEIKGKWYYFDSQGYAYDNKWLLWKDKWYFFKKDSCEMVVNDWVEWKGKWCFMNKEGVLVVNDWVQSPYSGKWYFMDKDGYSVTNDWVKSPHSGKWYYFDSEGVMVTGTNVLINGKRYSFDPSGALI